MMMKGLIALLAGLAAVATAVFFWSRNRRAANSPWHEVEDTTSSWAKTADEKVGEATDKVAAVADEAASAASDAG
jgi:Flp pilus assembly secretin CpaC